MLGRACARTTLVQSAGRGLAPSKCENRMTQSKYGRTVAELAREPESTPNDVKTGLDSTLIQTMIILFCSSMQTTQIVIRSKA